MINNISFPNFNITLAIDPVAFRFYNIAVRWYSLIVLFGIIMAFFYILKNIKRYDIDIDKFYNLILYALPLAIVSSRIYYVAFNWKEYTDISEIFKIWHGGLAIYGGLLGGIITTIIYCKFQYLDTYKILDISSVGLLIGQSIGRWGNFTNAEAYGTRTGLPWAMSISCRWSEITSVHPTFIYESLWNAIGIWILLLYRKKQRFKGELFLAYIVYYGLGRAWIENLRADSLMFYSFRISQVLAIFSVIIGVTSIIFLRKGLDERMDQFV